MKKKGLMIDDRSDTFVPDYLNKEKSTTEQYDEYCRKNPLKNESNNKKVTA